MKELLNQVAARLKELRLIFDYTEQEIAKSLNIPVDTYVLYEQDGADIPISVVYHLANLYNVDTTEILTGKSPKLNTLCVVKKDEGIKVERFAGYRYENIAHKFIHRVMEPMVVTLEPSAEKPTMVVHAGQEINYCLEGKMVLYYDGIAYFLEAGDCAYFDSTHPHGQAASGGENAKFLTVIKE